MCALSNLRCKIRCGKSSKLCHSARYIYKRADKATKQIRYREEGWRYHLHEITFNLGYVKSGPLPVALSEVRDRRGSHKKERLYLRTYTVSHTCIHTIDYIGLCTLSVVMGMIRPQQSIKVLRIRPLSMTYGYQRGNMSIARHTCVKHYLIYIFRKSSLNFRSF